MRETFQTPSDLSDFVFAHETNHGDLAHPRQFILRWRQRDAPVVTGHPEACARTSLGDRRSQQVKGPTMVRSRQRERIAERRRTVPRNPAVTQPNGREATCLNLDRGSDLDLYRRFPQGARKSLPFPSPVLAPIYN